jgi:cell wall-associated NlpC family hydrolase
MNDPRVTASNGRVAALDLKGKTTAEQFIKGVAATLIAPIADLCDAPQGARTRQLLLGNVVQVFEDRDGWSFVQSHADHYVGYVQSAQLGAHTDPTHMVATPATHAYATDDMKSANLMGLPFGAKLAVVDERKRFYETPYGFVPKSHLRPLSHPFSDPATVAQLHYGVPYLWGGNTTRGIDCSGLIQAALMACGLPCPADSDMQCDQLGNTLPDDARLARGDLIFWQGHVGMMVDKDTLLHANAHHMACVYEPIVKAIARIAAQGDGPVLAHKRL